MAASEQFAGLLEKSMLEQSNVFTAQQNRATAGDAAVAELVRNGYGFSAVNSSALVGAHAAGQLDKDVTANRILDARAVRDQPASRNFAKPPGT